MVVPANTGNAKITYLQHNDHLRRLEHNPDSLVQEDFQNRPEKDQEDEVLFNVLFGQYNGVGATMTLNMTSDYQGNICT